MEQARYADLVTGMQNVSSKIADVSIKLSTADNDLLKDELKTFLSDTLKENNDNIKVIGKIFRENAIKHYPVRLK